MDRGWYWINIVDHDKDVIDDDNTTGMALTQSSWKNGSVVDVDHDNDNYVKDFDDNATGTAQTLSSWKYGSVVDVDNDDIIIT